MELTTRGWLRVTRLRSRARLSCASSEGRRAERLILSVRDGCASLCADVTWPACQLPERANDGHVQVQRVSHFENNAVHLILIN